uniref:Uncharacterized protein n=1 Tax=Chromera velia CCMP2878 TaxID=1169474 RepID=A0A0G4FUX9_9ALVE|eukprot:Cvel_3776.t1-p1 / transcript=Cvel_3776.t1 / gene=Cvel_3776 / organism=Chromera_velia_CCMP2878 / gene_product=Poly(A) RNA polymerase GLD2-A, putative / transcript_product=Poly(A) RNA polymerase GLD2-A, putative / location=Cvel_scaffold158:56751-69647(-) / protein_length=1099 / sequence_SO=supercontig / SO=protein_coding / is_pseudo=false
MEIVDDEERTGLPPADSESETSSRSSSVRHTSRVEMKDEEETIPVEIDPAIMETMQGCSVRDGVARHVAACDSFMERLLRSLPEARTVLLVRLMEAWLQPDDEHKEWVKDNEYDFLRKLDTKEYHGAFTAGFSESVEQMYEFAVGHLGRKLGEPTDFRKLTNEDRQMLRSVYTQFERIFLVVAPATRFTHAHRDETEGTLEFRKRLAGMLKILRTFPLNDQRDPRPHVRLMNAETACALDWKNKLGKQMTVAKVMAGVGNLCKPQEDDDLCFVEIKRIDNALTQVYKKNLLEPKAITFRRQMLDRVSKEVAKIHGGRGQLVAYGSSVSGFADVFSDCDVLVPADKRVGRQDFDIDVTFGDDNPISLRNSKLLRAYAELEAECHELGIMVKLWARARGLICPKDGGLSSYAWMNMVIYFLQHRGGRKEGILPNLQDPQAYPDPMEGNYNASFSRDGEMKSVNTYFYDPPFEDKVQPPWYKGVHEPIGPFEPLRMRDTSNMHPYKKRSPALLELLLGFFYFYATEFSVHSEVISIGETSRKTKAEVCGLGTQYDKDMGTGSSMSFWNGREKLIENDWFGGFTVVDPFEGLSHFMFASKEMTARMLYELWRGAFLLLEFAEVAFCNSERAKENKPPLPLSINNLKMFPEKRSLGRKLWLPQSTSQPEGGKRDSVAECVQVLFHGCAFSYDDPSAQLPTPKEYFQQCNARVDERIACDSNQWRPQKWTCGDPSRRVDVKGKTSPWANGGGGWDNDEPTPAPNAQWGRGNGPPEAKAKAPGAPQSPDRGAPSARGPAASGASLRPHQAPSSSQPAAARDAPERNGNGGSPPPKPGAVRSSVRGVSAGGLGVGRGGPQQPQKSPEGGRGLPKDDAWGAGAESEKSPLENSPQTPTRQQQERKRPSALSPSPDRRGRADEGDVQPQPQGSPQAFRNKEYPTESKVGFPLRRNQDHRDFQSPPPPWWIWGTAEALTDIVGRSDSSVFGYSAEVMHESGPPDDMFSSSGEVKVTVDEEYWYSKRRRIGVFALRFSVATCSWLIRILHLGKVPATTMEEMANLVYRKLNHDIDNDRRALIQQKNRPEERAFQQKFYSHIKYVHNVSEQR